MSPVNVNKSQLPPSGQEAAFGQALHGSSVLQSASPVVDRFSDAASHSDFHGPATADSEFDDSHSVSEEEVDVKLSLRLKPAMVTAAQVSAKYFAEGVTAMTSSAAPPPSVAGDFRPALMEVQGYRFSESPSVAYELSRVLARTSGSENSLPVDTVPLLAAHGQAPDAAQPWLASDQLRKSSTSFHSRKFALSRRHHSLIETYALPSAPLPVTPESANLREDVYLKPQTPTISGTSSLTDGENTTLTCSSASALINATYEWYADGSVISGASTSTYTTPAVSMMVPQMPVITSSPSGTTEDASSFTLTCVTPSTNMTTETYKWSIDGADQSSQSSSTLTQTADINNVPAYSCKVSGDRGTDYSAVSTTFTPFVKPQAPTISGASSLIDGDTTTLTCSSASSPLVNATYDWYADGIAVSGVSSSTYTTPAVSMSDDGKVYTCKVTFNNVTSDLSSNNMSLTVVPQKPSISSSPSGDIEDASNFILTCQTASANLTTEMYVWNIGGADQSSQSSKTLTQTADINNVLAYSCKVSGDGGTDYSTVSTTFTPSVKPQTPTLNGTSSLTDGDTTILTCSSASSPLSGATYEWYADGIAVSGASSSTYTTSALSMSDDSTVYSCKVTLSGVTSDPSSNNLTLTVVPQTPSISVSPSGVITDTDNFSLTCVTASTGLSTETYVWNIGGTDQSSQSSNTLTQTADINNVQAYSCKVSGDGGTDYSAVSTTFTPSVKPQTPIINGTASLMDGESTNLTCSSASSPMVNATYEWYADGIAVSGASSSTYTTPAVSMSDDGKVYTCKVVFNAVTSDISSTSVTLTIVPQTPTISNSASGKVEDTTNFNLTCVTASTGLSTETYVWNIDGADQSSQSSSTLTQTADINNVLACSCKVSGDGGTDYSADSSTFTPSVTPQTPILAASTGVAVADGSGWSIICASASTPTTSPMTYTFYFGTSNSPLSVNQTGDTYRIAAVTLINAGEYRCTATVGGVESAQSNSATLLVTAQTPTLTLSEAEAVEGNNITLVCTTLSITSGSEIYTWFDNGSNLISGPVSQQYSFLAAFGDAGDYYCSIVLHGTESAVSAAYALTVKPQTPSLSGGNTVIEGSNLVLSCGYTGTLPSTGFTYAWFNGTTTISGATADTYTLTTVTFDDTGTFACAVNVAGVTSNSSADYPVSVQPKTPTMLVSPTPPIFDGSSITINCTSDSETLMTGGFTVTLLRTNNGVRTVISSVNVSTSTSYTTTVSASHAGDYSCKIAYRGVDSLSSAVTSVSVKPQTPAVSLVESQAVDGDTMTLQCVTASSLSQSTSYTWKNVKPLAPTVSGLSTIVDGSSVTLTCNLISTNMPSPVGYSWSDDSGVITSASGATYTINPVTLTDTSNYTCSVSAYGVSSDSSASHPLLVKVQTPSVKGTGDVTSLIVDDGTSVNVTCVTTSTLTMTSTYTWYGTGDTILAGQSDVHYTLSAVSLANSGDLKCSINYNSIESSLSNAFPLSVTPATPTVTGPSATVGTGSAVTLTCTTTSLPPGSATLTYSWQKGNAVQSELTSQFVLDPTVTSDTGNYTCTVAYSGVTSNTSAALTLTVQDPPAKPAITPSKLIVGTGDTVTLTCDNSSSSTSSFTYIWQKGGTITSTTSQVLTLSSAVLSDGGDYVCVVVDGDVASTGSNSYTLTVIETQVAPNITVSPIVFDFNAAVNLTCQPATTGSGYSFAWSRDGDTLSETGSQLSISSFAASNAGTYTCAVVDQGIASTVSSGTIVTASSAPAKPSITTSPSNFTTGDQVTLTCSGSESSYEWVKDGTVVSGESTENLNLTSFSNTDTGSYACVAISTSSVRSATSDAVQLSPQGAPDQPVVSVSPTTFKEGDPMSLTCTSLTTGSLTYKWFKDGTTLGDTMQSLIYSSFQTVSNAGSFSCKVTLSGVQSMASNTLDVGATVVPSAPTVTLSSTSVVTEESVTLTCSPATPGTYLYVWIRNGSPVPSETSATYVISSATTSDDGNYTCTVTDANGLTSVASGAQSLAVTGE
ncbi:serine-rich adhesin for platelets-like [Littorina saxatilis]|uniref:serine-rich adhesin for platelets-like n=1 Tax=Littorina saxatilis TaxID=31220 RepID=UPI0038B60DD0